MQKRQPLATGLAIGFLALLLAGLIARFWASDKAYQFTGPTHIAAGAEHVYVFAAGSMYHLTVAGELLSVVSSETTGLNDDPIDLRVLADGRLLIAEQRPARIRLCEVDSWICDPLGEAARSVIEHQFKVLPGTSPGELLFTDAHGDTLWRLDGAGGEPQKLLPDGTLASPNGLAFDHSGSLWVADTNHRKIVELLPSGNGSYLPGREHSAMNSLTVGERFYPIMLAPMVDGRLWVTQAAEVSKAYSDLVVYDPENGAQSLIDLPGGAYATDIVTLGDAVLVTDLERFIVYLVQADTLEVGEFGDEPFRQAMGQIQERRAYFDRLGDGSLAAMILFAVLMILAAIRATPKERRWTPTPSLIDFSNAPEQVPAIKGIHWLERNPKTERSLKWLGHLGYILFVLMIAGAFVLYVWARTQAGPDPSQELTSKLNDLGISLLLFGLLGGLILPLIHFSTRAMKRKLGTDGKRLYIKLTDGRELSVDPAQLAYTNRFILYRKYTLPLQGGKQQQLYAPGEVETWLAPLLRQSRKLTEIQALKHQIKNWN